MRQSVHYSLKGAVAGALTFVAAIAHADDTEPTDTRQSEADAAKHPIDRTWLYVDDARVAEPMTVVGMSSFSYTEVGSSPSRVASPYPTTYRGFAFNTAQPGGLLSIGGEVGLLPRLSVIALGQVGMGGVDGVPNPSGGGIVGLRLRLSPSDWQHVHLAMSAGYLRETWSGPVFDGDSGQWVPGSPHGDNGAWIQAALSGDIQRLRLATSLHAEHIFWPGRDTLDVMADLGVSYRVVDALRLGIEYVGQDLEEAVDPAAEGGARHFIGPIASLQLLGDRMTIAAGPSLGLSSTSPALVGRLAVSYGF